MLQECFGCRKVVGFVVFLVLFRLYVDHVIANPFGPCYGFLALFYLYRIVPKCNATGNPSVRVCCYGNFIYKKCQVITHKS